MEIKTIFLEDTLFPLNESKKKLEKIPLSTKERELVKEKFADVNIQCSFAKTSKNEYFCYTHRARSKFYDSIESIPEKVVEFISSTS